MKRFLSILGLATIMSLTATAQDGTLGKPGATDTIASANSYGMAINNDAQPLGNKKQLAVHFTVTNVDSVKNVYVKLQCRQNGSWADIANTQGDSTYVALTNTTAAGNAKGYVLTAPTKLTPTLALNNWRLLVVVPGASKFTISGNWAAK